MFLFLQSLVVYCEKHINQGIRETIIGCKGEAHDFKNITTRRSYLIWEVSESFSEQVMSELKSE